MHLLLFFKFAVGKSYISLCRRTWWHFHSNEQIDGQKEKRKEKEDKNTEISLSSEAKCHWNMNLFFRGHLFVLLALIIWFFLSLCLSLKPAQQVYLKEEFGRRHFNHCWITGKFSSSPSSLGSSHHIHCINICPDWQPTHQAELLNITGRVELRCFIFIW